jgi:hypothetical protein
MRHKDIQETNVRTQLQKRDRFESHKQRNRHKKTTETRLGRKQNVHSRTILYFKKFLSGTDYIAKKIYNVKQPFCSVVGYSA